MEPLNNYVVLQPEPETASKGGIIYPENCRRLSKGKVVSVPAKFTETHTSRVGLETKVLDVGECKVGDTVMFVPHASMYECDDLILIDVRDLVAKL